MSQTKANKDAPQPKVIRGTLPQEEMPQGQLELAKMMGSGSNSTDFCTLFEAIKTVMRAGGHDDGLFQGTVDGKPPELEFAVKVMKEVLPLTSCPLHHVCLHTVVTTPSRCLHRTRSLKQ